jgi:hypothetical protein
MTKGRSDHAKENAAAWGAFLAGEIETHLSPIPNNREQSIENWPFPDGSDPLDCGRFCLNNGEGDWREEMLDCGGDLADRWSCSGVSRNKNSRSWRRPHWPLSYEISSIAGIR